MVSSYVKWMWMGFNNIRKRERGTKFMLTSHCSLTGYYGILWRSLCIEETRTKEQMSCHKTNCPGGRIFWQLVVHLTFVKAFSLHGTKRDLSVGYSVLRLVASAPHFLFETNLCSSSFLIHDAFLEVRHHTRQTLF